LDYYNLSASAGGSAKARASDVIFTMGAGIEL